MTKIQQNLEKKQITSKLFYIDSGLFILDADLFESVTIPNNIIQVDGDTGETIREFKTNSLKLEYRNFDVYIANYTKKLPNNAYNKLKFSFKAKVCNNYLKGIQKIDIEEFLQFLKTKNYINYDNKELNNIINEIRYKDIDITYNVTINTVDIPLHIDTWQLIKKTSPDIKVGNANNNQMIQFGKRGNKYFFKIYNKNLEIRRKLDEYYNLKLTAQERNIFESPNKTMLRMELTLRKAEDYNISNKLVDLWAMLENDENKIHNLVKLFYDKNTGNYIPKKRVYGELSPQDKVIISFLLYLKSIGKDYLEMINIALSQFDSDTNKDRMTKSRVKKKIQKLIDYLYSNNAELKAQAEKNNKTYNFIMKEMFFKDI